MAARRDESFGSVMTALAANTAIAAAKGTAAALTASPALLAKTLHSVADAGNELFLWVALRRSRRAPDSTHPLGYGPERYYWALLAAAGMFCASVSRRRRGSRRCRGSTPSTWGHRRCS